MFIMLFLHFFKDSNSYVFLFGFKDLRLLFEALKIWPSKLFFSFWFVHNGGRGRLWVVDDDGGMGKVMSGEHVSDKDSDGLTFFLSLFRTKEQMNP